MPSSNILHLSTLLKKKEGKKWLPFANGQLLVSIDLTLVFLPFFSIIINKNMTASRNPRAIVFVGNHVLVADNRGTTVMRKDNIIVVIRRAI